MFSSTLLDSFFLKSTVIPMLFESSFLIKIINGFITFNEAAKSNYADDIITSCTLDTRVVQYPYIIQEVAKDEEYHNYQSNSILFQWI